MNYKKIEQLTRTQEKQMRIVREKWLKLFFSGKKINRPKAKRYIEWLYSEAKLKKPAVVFLESPFGIQYGANLIKKIFGEKKEVSDQVYGQVSDQVRDEVSDQVYDQVRDQVRDQVSDQVYGQVSGQVRDEVSGQVKKENLEFFNWAWTGLAWDSEWLSFYDFFQKIGIKYKEKRFKEYIKIAETGIYDAIFLEGIVLLASLPSKVHRNKEGRLHCETGPAIEWRDGYKLWYLNGVVIQPELFNKIPAMTAEEVLGIENSEIRRVVFEVMNKKKLETLKDFQVLEEIRDDGYGNPMRIIQFSHSVFHKPVRMLNVFCASTKREYYLWTERDKCWDAKMISFGLPLEMRFNEEY